MPPLAAMRILIHLLLLSVALALSWPARALDNELKDWLVTIGQSQESAERTEAGVRQRGVWVARQGPCSRIGVLVGAPEAPERIDNYRVCGTRVIEVAETAPPPSSSEFFKTVLANAIRTGVLSGDYTAKAEGFEIRSQRRGEADAKGCAQVETTISNDLLLAGNRLTHACP